MWNQRYFWVLAVFTLFFLIDSGFPLRRITSKECVGGNCKQLIKESSLSDVNLKFFQNDVFSSQMGEFYRLTFREKANQDTIISIKATNIFYQEIFLQEFPVWKSKDDNFKEVIFATDRNYTDFIIEKKNIDGAEVILSDFRVTRLNVKNDDEMRKISPTIFGEIDTEKIASSQAQNTVLFKQLLQPKIIFGQIFKAGKDYITEIEVDFNIIQQGSGNGGNYEFVLRKADFKNSVPEIKGGALASIKFSSAEAMQYREPNGKFKFPIYEKVDVGEYYFFGINNERADSNKFNYLEMLGSSDSKIYSDGSVVLKKDGETFPIKGNLYFNIFGLDYKEYAGQRIFLGTTLEDLGDGKMLFKFQPSQKQYALTDLNSFTSDVSFDEEKKIVFGEIYRENPKNDSNFIYKFENALPFRSFRLSAQKNNLDWENVRLLYSFDDEKWQEITKNPDSKDGMQVFEKEITEAFRKNIVYLKIEPIITDETFQDRKTVKYGLDKLLIEAETQANSQRVISSRVEKSN